MTEQNKTHGVLTDVANELWAAAQLAPGEGIECGVYRIEKILEAKAAPQSTVADERAKFNKYALLCRMDEEDRATAWHVWQTRALLADAPVKESK